MKEKDIRSLEHTKYRCHIKNDPKKKQGPLPVDGQQETIRQNQQPL